MRTENTDMNDVRSTKVERMQAKFKSGLKSKVDWLNKAFDNLSFNAKRISLIAIGSAMAGICTGLIFQAVLTEAESSISIDKITLPHDIYMNQPSTHQLTHIGKMKGEVDGEFESFHVAIDDDGGLFINRDPEYSKDSLQVSKGWEPITRQQWETYEKQLHFIPDRPKGLRR